MQLFKVQGSKFKVQGSGWLFAGFAAVAVLAGCSQGKQEETQGAKPADLTQPVAKGKEEVHSTADGDLLMRVRFAGTTALMADTNAAYLTNIAALPETAALGQRIVERMASLPGLLAKKPSAKRQKQEAGAGKGGNIQPPTINAQPSSTNPLEPMFAEMLRTGFVLELRGDSNGVDRMLLAGKASSEAAARWQTALAGVGGSNQMAVLTTNGWVTVSMSRQPGTLPASVFRPPSSDLEAPNILEVELASSLLPEPIQRSVYGGFERLNLKAIPTDRGFKIVGTASYAADLPQLTGAPVAPTNLVTEPLISFTLVREPGAWLAPDSAIRRFLPRPIPDTAYFWGGESSPYQFFVAVPFEGTNRFLNDFGPALFAELEKLALATDSGPVVLDTNRPGVQWQTVPFVAPNVTVKTSGEDYFLVAETFPAPDFTNGLSPTLTDRILGGTNMVLFDWEFTQARIDTWFRIGQLALLVSENTQLAADKASLKWLQAAQTALPSGGNMFTEISQTGPRELSLNRVAPVGFSSLELFWLANWLESENFPAANFLVPVPPVDWGTGTNSNQ